MNRRLTMVMVWWVLCMGGGQINAGGVVSARNERGLGDVDVRLEEVVRQELRQAYVALGTMSTEDLLAYARGQRRRSDGGADPDYQEAAIYFLGQRKDPRLVPVAQALLLGRETLPYPEPVAERVRNRVAESLGVLGTPAARAVLEEAMEATVRMKWHRGDKSGKGPHFGDILRALEQCGDAKSLELVERYRTFDDPWIPKIVADQAPRLRARLVVAGQVPVDARALEALRVLEEGAARWGAYGEQLKREQIEPLRAALVKAGLLAPATGGFQPMKALPAGATALMAPATGAPR